MKKKWILILFLLLGAPFLVHQYEYADPYDALLRKESFDRETILRQLKRWRYHNYVWFDFVPDAFTTVFKRLGMGGWSETGHRACIEGCPYWTEWWTDGFHTVDLELEKISIDGEAEISFSEPRFFDVETWGKIRSQLERIGKIPGLGKRVRICGPLRVDRPYFVFTLHPDRAEDYQILESCEAFPKEAKSALEKVGSLSCDQIASLSLFEQIALLDALSDKSGDLTQPSQIEKTVSCVKPQVLEALATNGDVYEALLTFAPSIREKLPPLRQDRHQREGNPILNTVRDLWKYLISGKKEG